MSVPVRSETVTNDPAEACALISATYSNTRLSVVGNSVGFRFSQVLNDLGAVRVDRLQNTLTTEAVGDPVGSVIICRVLEHFVELDVGTGFRKFGPGDIFVGQRPDRGYRSVQCGLSAEAVSIDLSFLREVACADHGDQTCLSEHGFGEPLTPHAARGWQQAVRYVSRGVLADPTAAASPLLVDSARRLLAATMITLLDARPELQSADTRDATSATVQRAVAFIEANPDLAIGVADIARAAFVTPRAVQLAFRRHLDVTPTAYLRRVRLEHARDELIDADPAYDTVTTIAARWGFTSSRFASLYRETYHEQPSETLHR
ncbi:MAG TPA: helix-turn-helix transcriptional regulator [Jatrophihabitans sp.]|jgi:AraC-like DNA-binding protein